jgi:predicted dehydrogenase
VTEPLGVAIVGAGYWGPNLLRNVQAYAGTRVRGVCDVDRVRAEAAARHDPLIRTTTSLDDVLSDPGVGAVAVATPAATHVEVALACLETDRHVLIEKPLALSVAEGEKLVEIAARRGLVLMCDHTYCYTPAVRRIRDWSRGGGLGDVQYFDSVRINLGLVRSEMDVFWDLAPHDLSILDFVLPDDCRPLAVAAHGADPIGAGQLCVGYLTIPLSGGAIAHVHVNWLSPTKVRRTIIGGTRRMVVWDDLEPTVPLHIYDKGVEFRVAPGAEASREALVSYRIGDMLAPALPQVEPLSEVVTEFHTAIAERREALTNGTSGLRVLSILEAATASLAADGASIPIGSR